MSADAVSNEEEGRLGDGSVHDAIASNLRGARLAKGLSLRELARRIGTSKALLSQIENVQANPTIDVLERIATALNLSIGDLSRTPLLVAEIIRRGEGAEIVGENVTIRSLFSTSDRRRFEFSEGRLPARSCSSRNAHHRGSVEYAFVIEGAVRIEAQDWSVSLSRGDCVRFSSEFEHSYVTSSRPATVLTVITFADD